MNRWRWYSWCWSTKSYPECTYYRWSRCGSIWYLWWSSHDDCWWWWREGEEGANYHYPGIDRNRRDLPCEFYRSLVSFYCYGEWNWSIILFSIRKILHQFGEGFFYCFFLYFRYSDTTILAYECELFSDNSEFIFYFRFIIFWYHGVRSYWSRAKMAEILGG